MSAEILLSRLDKVRPAGRGRWMARCPAHEDKTPSLSIRETDDGRLLLHDFGQGCAAVDIVSAVGLTLADLFPEPLTAHRAGSIQPHHWHAAREALRSIQFEVLLVAVASENIVRGQILSKDDRGRLALATRRIRQAAELVE